MKPIIFVSRKIPDKGLEMLKEKFDVRVHSPEDGEDQISKEELLKGVEDADALLPLLSDKIDKEVMDTGKNLKIIANYAVGYNNIDVDYATEKRIPVTNTPDVLTQTTADFAMTLLLAAARRLVESDNFTRKGKFKTWAPELLLGQDVYNKTIGIIGFGRIGKEVAKRAALGFGMKVLYTDPVESTNLKFDAKKVEFDELLKESDFISIHVPLVDTTQHLIGEKELSMMKKTAVLVNTSRGAVIDEKALIKALQQKDIFAAGLDVYEEEPMVPKELMELDNVILAPHTASASFEARDGMAVMAAQNIIDFFEDKTPEQILNKEVLEGK